MKDLLRIVFVIFLSRNEIFALTQKKIICMYDKTSNNRGFLTEGNFKVDNIDPNLCTHLVYAYFGITEDGKIRTKDQYFDFESNGGNVNNFNNLKHYNTKLQTLAAVGGWQDEASLKYSNMAKDENKRKTFIKTSIEFLLDHNFDGLALHWCFPGIHGGDPSIDKKNYSKLVKELHKELTENNLLLMLIVHGHLYQINDSYEISELSRNADMIYVTSFNFFGEWSSHIGHPSGLYLSSKLKDDAGSTDSAMNIWLHGGVPPNKLIMGVPLYGRTFTLKNEKETELGSPSNGAGRKSKYIESPGFITYMEICQRIKTEKWITKWEETQMVPYAYLGDQWAAFENESSIEIKAKYANEKKFGGIAVSGIEDDDYRGFCGEKFGLLRVINSILKTANAQFEYIINLSVFKRDLEQNNVQCVYHKSDQLELF